MDTPVAPSQAFTRMSTINLAQPHSLHPEACNPTMDLVVLLHEDEGRTKVALWRMASGSKVWEVDIVGRILGLAWSRGGLVLSLFVLRLPSFPAANPASAVDKSTIEHRSVHTGELIKSVPAPRALFGSLQAIDYGAVTDRTRAPWWEMRWLEGAESWPTPQPGSALNLIEQLPRVTPVDPPKPVILNPFAPIQPTAKAKPGANPKLATFPSLLPTTPRVSPDVLAISPRGATASLLTGTLLLPDGTPTPTPRSTLALAESADKLETLLDVILRGLEAAQNAFKESEKQTMIWREELETCAEQQGMSTPDVHADLFRLLMISRSGPAVAEWLGNRMTNRTVAKWESTLETAFSTIKKVITESITPALERIMLVLDEMAGWSSDLVESDLVLDPKGIATAKDICRGFSLLVEDMRQASELEEATSAEWSKWLRYAEISRSAAITDDSVPIVTHDIKLVWSFMKNGFVNSQFRQNFPVGSANDLLPEGLPRPTTPTVLNLDSTIRNTLSRLTGSPRLPESVASPPQAPDYSWSSSRASPRPDEPSFAPSSPDTVGDNEKEPIAPEEPPRVLEREPFPWANSLVAACSAIIASSRPRKPAPEPTPDPLLTALPNTPLAERSIGFLRWLVATGPSGLDIVAHDLNSGEVHAARLQLEDGTITQAAFFDNDDLAVVFDAGGEHHLGTAKVAALAELMAIVDLAALGEESIPRAALPIDRRRSLGSSRRHGLTADPWLLALNGRAGRRSGCVLVRGGTQVEALDLEGDEEEEEEEVEEDVDME
ncbi:uncharacterized protein LOC62_04G005390 [Vanrija pseudolonga]|uniref:Anaphase-promoting complex subunit 4 n=1 Tax=Vanrija pseudolonga TaxID=143232 RepID=A0AAF0Y868_9TREE|nr:hypothetical protein LOC62_04G005390 [Vanrija pseudolonga]